MRTTNRTLTCDRCGTPRRVQSFSWGALTGAADEGWVKYASVTARTNIDPHKYNDLCPDCAVRMARVMEDGVRSHEDIVHELLIDIHVLTDERLTDLRDFLTRTLKKRRSDAAIKEMNENTVG